MQSTQNSREERNARRFVVSFGLRSIGDQLLAAKTVLPWLLTATGAAPWIIGLLVPVREAGSMLPQLLLEPWLSRQRRRTWIWVAGILGHSIAAVAMAAFAVFTEANVAGLGILAALAVLALTRALSSLSGKDIQGRTISKGRRGRVTGRAAAAGGLAALTVGVGIRLLGGTSLPTWALAALLLVATVVYLASAMVFSRMEEPAATPETGGTVDRWHEDFTLLRHDQNFRRFVVVRSLLLVSALAPAFLVSLAAQTSVALDGLGPFLVATGLASLLGGRIFGRFADRNARAALTIGATGASLTIVATIALTLLVPAAALTWLLPLAFFILSLLHTMVRIARKTYVIDMAEDGMRTRYIAVSNTAMGVILLLVGGISAVLAMLGNLVALGFLAALGVLGALMSRLLPNVSADAAPTAGS